MTLVLGQESTPAAPSSGKTLVYIDSADGRPKARASDGTVTVLAPVQSPNLLVNGLFQFAQRQTPGTLTTYSNTTGRTYGLDRWGITNENASAQVRRVDTAAAAETGLGARFYAEIKKITSTGKLAYSEVLEGSESIALRGRKVRVQFKAKNSVGSHTLRCALLYLTSSGTIDTIPATFVSAFGAASTDPTWGTHLTALAPSVVNANSTIVGSGISAVLTSAWRWYGGVFTVPTNSLNLVVVIFTDGQMTAGDIWHLSEVGLFDGEEERSAVVADTETEQHRCERFCWKTFAIDTGPVQNIGNFLGCLRWTAHSAGAVLQRSPVFPFPVRMRAAPTVTTYNPSTANVEVRDSLFGGDSTGTAIQSNSDRSFAIVCTGNPGTVVGGTLVVHVLCEAEL